MTLSKHATTAATIGNELIVTYHQTVIVKADPDKITLNFGHPDYVTPTTIRKMNQASEDYSLGFKVKKEKGLVNVRKGSAHWILGKDEIILTFPRN